MDYYVEIFGKDCQLLRQVSELENEGVQVDFILSPDLPSDKYHLIVIGARTEDFLKKFSTEKKPVLLISTKNMNAVMRLS